MGLVLACLGNAGGNGCNAPCRSCYCCFLSIFFSPLKWIVERSPIVTADSSLTERVRGLIMCETGFDSVCQGIADNYGLDVLSYASARGNPLI